MQLMELNRIRFQKIFQLIGQSNNGKITYNDLQKFCKQTNIIPDLTNASDLKKIVANALQESDKLQINTNFQFVYEQFENILLEIATQTLHLAKNKTERIKIFLLHIKNPCKMHYQIQNFIVDINKSAVNNTSQISKSISKVQATQESQQSLLDTKSEKSLNYIINPQLSQKTNSGIPSQSVSPAKNSQFEKLQQKAVTITNDEDIYQLENLIKNQKSGMSRTQKLNNLDYSNSMKSLHQSDYQNKGSTRSLNKASFESDLPRSQLTQRTQIDDNLELALKTLKTHQKVSQRSQGSSLSRNSSQQQLSRKDQILSSLKQQIIEQKSKTHRGESSNKIGSTMNDKLLYHSPQQINQDQQFILVEETLSSGTKSNQLHSPDGLQSGIRDSQQTIELQEFLEYENQIVNENQDSGQKPNKMIGSSESSMHLILSPKSKFTNIKDQQQSKSNQKHQQSVVKNNGISSLQKQQETNFTFAENRRLSSTRNADQKQINLQDSLDSKQAYGVVTQNLSKYSKSSRDKVSPGSKNQTTIAQNIQQRQSTKSRERSEIKSKNIKQQILKDGIQQNPLSPRKDQKMIEFNNRKLTQSSQKQNLKLNDNKKSINTTNETQNRSNSNIKNSINQMRLFNQSSQNEIRNSSRDSTDQKKLELKTSLQPLSNIKQLTQTPQNQSSYKQNIGFQKKEVKEFSPVKDQLQQALEREEKRKQEKINKYEQYKTKTPQIEKFIRITKIALMRQGMQSMLRFNYSNIKTQNNLRNLVNIFKTKQRQNLNVAFYKIFKLSQQKNLNILKGLLILSNSKTLSKLNQGSKLLIAFSKYKDFIQKQRLTDLKEMQQYIIQLQKQNQEFIDQQRRLTSLNRHFQQRLQDI